MIPQAEVLRQSSNPFLASDAPTLADVINGIEANDSLSESRRRDICSAVRTLARLLNKSPEEVPASPSWLRRRLNNVHPRQAGMSAKRFANVKSDLLAGLPHLRIPEGRNPHRAGISPEWQRLWGTLPKGALQWGLSRFVRFCSSEQIPPDHVDDCTAEAFRQALVEESLVKEPDKLCARTVRNWNAAADTVPVWPQKRLTPQCGRQVWVYPLERFPESFQRDVEAWLDQLRGDDPLSDAGPARPLRPSTIRSHRMKIREFASAVVRRDCPIEDINGLADLVNVETFKEGLRFFLARSNGPPGPAVYQIASTMKSIARHHVRVDAGHLEELVRITGRLRTPNRGLTDKNRDRLRQFDNPRNIALLLHLPDRLRQRAQKRPPGDRRAALDYQMVVAIEVLLMCPMRIGNLAALAEDQHLSWERPGRKGQLHIAVAGSEVKNREPIEYVLPRESGRLVSEYLEHYRPSLCAEANEWLYPGQAGRHKTTTSLSGQIRNIIHKETGLIVNAHLFRHLGAKLFLSTHPGGYEVVRRVLGHRSTETTTAFYTGFESKAAARHYDEAILAHRRAGGPGKGVKAA
jgi:integrase